MERSVRIQMFSDILSPKHPTSIVDIGASPITGKPPYSDILKSGRSVVTGFEPDEQALADLKTAKGPNERYFPYAVGDGKRKTYFATPATGLSSTKKLSPWVGSYLGPWWQKQSSRVKEIPLSTKRLDDIAEIQRMDFLKIDIQGGELEVFENAPRLLEKVCIVQTEIALMPFYDDQPSFSDIQRELERKGLISFCFSTINRRRIYSNFGRSLPAKVSPSQILDLDVIFIRNPVELDQCETEQIKHLAILAFGVLGAMDLAFKCIDVLEQRDAIKSDELLLFFQAEHQ